MFGFASSAVECWSARIRSGCSPGSPAWPAVLEENYNKKIKIRGGRGKYSDQIGHLPL